MLKKLRQQLFWLMIVISTFSALTIAPSVAAKTAYCWQISYELATPQRVCYESLRSDVCTPVNADYTVDSSDTTIYQDNACEEKFTNQGICKNTSEGDCSNTIELTAVDACPDGYEGPYSSLESCNANKKWCKKAGTCKQVNVLSSGQCPSNYDQPAYDAQCTCEQKNYCYQETYTGGTVSKSCSLSSDTTSCSCWGSIYGNMTQTECEAKTTLSICYNTYKGKCEACNSDGTCSSNCTANRYNNYYNCKIANKETDTSPLEVEFDKQTASLSASVMTSMKGVLYGGDFVPANLVNKFMSSVLFPLAGVLLFLLIVYAGYLMVQGSVTGNQGTFDAGRQRLTAAIIGFVIMFCAYGIWKVVESFLGIKVTG